MATKKTMNTKTARRWFTIVIDESRWLNSSVLSACGEMQSSLRDRRSGLQCCLGFGCRQSGYSSAQITNRALPSALATGSLDLDTLYARLWTIEDAASEINDDIADPAARKRSLRRIFRTVNIRLKFIGSPAKALARARAAYPPVVEE